MENNPSGTDDVLRPSGPDGADSRRGGWWFPLLLLGIVVGMACLGLMRQGNRPSEAVAVPGSPTPLPAGKMVRLQVDFGNGATKDFAALAWHKGMTIADLMEQARRFRPPMQYRQQGKGPAAFLDSIEGVKPESNSGRGWKYRVNGQHGEVSFGIHPLQPGDHVLWSIEASQ